MFKSLLEKLFTSNKKQHELTKELEHIPGFKTKEEMELSGSTIEKRTKFILKKGEVLPVLLPKFGNLSNFKITKWYFQTGDLVKEGDVLCEIENEKVILEFEGLADGRIYDMYPINRILKTGQELCILEGL